MARGKRKSTIIQVKSAPANSSGVINLVKLSKEVNNRVCEIETKTVSIKSALKNGEKTTGCTNVVSTVTTDVTLVGSSSSVQHFAPRHANNKKNIEDEFIDVQLKTTGVADNATEVLEPDLMIVGVKAGEAKEESKEKKKNQKKHAPRTEVRTVNHTGCFGFVSTWLAKRKEKRRAKKRKAIQARNAKSDASLVVYGYRRTRGGIAFTVEMDSRPMRKSVLPPITQRSGRIRLGPQQKKMDSAVNKRAEYISKKREAAQAHFRLVRAVAERRAKNEHLFKQRTLQKTKTKEERAIRLISHLGFVWEQGDRPISITESTSAVSTSRVESISTKPTMEAVQSFTNVSTDGYCTDEDLFLECSIEHEIFDTVN